ncbi:hypothetical protein C8R44DRAFT_895720 [Mycena epipterygia]|nr:hypothetical protein C8R44DRAFT_895720 [Mycena epipterygia]
MPFGTGSTTCSPLPFPQLATSMEQPNSLCWVGPFLHDTANKYEGGHLLDTSKLFHAYLLCMQGTAKMKTGGDRRSQTLEAEHSKGSFLVPGCAPVADVQPAAHQQFEWRPAPAVVEVDAALGVMSRIVMHCQDQSTALEQAQSVLDRCDAYQSRVEQLSRLSGEKDETIASLRIRVADAEAQIADTRAGIEVLFGKSQKKWCRE